MDFIILKVNGQDVSGASHEEAIKVFNEASEPIIVEVVKRCSTDVNMSSSASAATAPASTSTSHYDDDDDDHTSVNTTKRRNSSSTTANNNNNNNNSSDEMSGCDVATQTDWMVLPSSASWAHASRFGAVDMLPMSGGLLDPDQCDSADAIYNYIPSTCLMEYEEVTLKRTNSENEKLGLTLCYGTPEDTETDIFISEIDPNSIAGQCDLIRVGDQILQINNIDVNTREQAVALFSEKTLSVTLLLARPQLQLEDFIEEEDIIEDKDIRREPTIDEEDEGTTDTGTAENGSTKHEKDSGVGRTDESTKNDESSEHEDLADNELTSPGNSGNNELNNSQESFVSLDDGERTNTEYEDKCIGTSRVDLASLANERRTDDEANGKWQRLSKASSQASIDRELALLNQEMKNIQIECQSLVQKHCHSSKHISKNVHNYVNLAPVLSQKPSSSLSKSIDKSHSVAEWVKSTSRSVKMMTPRIDENNTSSAYNTGDSCRSTPLTMELSHDRNRRHGSMISLVAPPPPTEEKGTQFIMDGVSDVYSSYSCESCRQCREERERRKGKYANQDFKTLPARCPSGREKSEKMVSVAPSETMYTNEANLEHTIWLQQQLFMKAMEQHHQFATAPAKMPDPRKLGLTKLPPSGLKGRELNQAHMGQQSIQMEWRVKRRPDGTRYITRRPVRNKMLKQRAQKIMEERAGITTDDDAMSELKVGRYWTKEDRKRQLEQARVHKLKREMMKAKISNGVPQVHAKISPVSRRKQTEFPNLVQEPSIAAQSSNNLLSVTTV